MNLPFFNLSKKVALVTGGATGIGYGIAEGLAQAGAQVVICSRRLEVCQQAARALGDKTGQDVLPLRCDVSQSTDIDSMLAQVQGQRGGVDILVNSAGIGGSEKPILKMEEPDWDRVLDINLKGVYRISRAVAAQMIERGQGGRIIQVASIGACLAWPNMSAYCASKGGLMQLTKVMALEWVKYNILVNAILPGYVETPMNTEFFATDAGKRIIQTKFPMRRLGQIDELKGVAILLASAASSFMTGSAVVVDGGNTAG